MSPHASIAPNSVPAAPSAFERMPLGVRAAITALLAITPFITACDKEGPTPTTPASVVFCREELDRDLRPIEVCKDNKKPTLEWPTEPTPAP